MVTCKMSIDTCDPVWLIADLSIDEVSGFNLEPPSALLGVEGVTISELTDPLRMDAVD